MCVRPDDCLKISGCMIRLWGSVVKESAVTPGHNGPGEEGREGQRELGGGAECKSVVSLDLCGCKTLQKHLQMKLK